MAKDIVSNHHCLYCFHVWSQAHNIDDVLYNMRLGEFDLTVLKSINVEVELIIYISLVVNV